MPTDQAAAMFFPSVYCIVFLGKISLDSATNQEFTRRTNYIFTGLSSVSADFYPEVKPPASGVSSSPPTIENRTQMCEDSTASNQDLPDWCQSLQNATGK